MSETRTVPKRETHPAPAEGHDRHDRLLDLRREVSELLDVMYEKIGREHHSVSGHIAKGSTPTSELGTTGSDFELTVELPGIDEADVEILVSGDLLTVKGEKRLARDERGRNYVVRERLYGSFSRSYALPPELDVERAEATYESGLLTVRIPLRPDAKRAKQIPIASR